MGRLDDIEKRVNDRMAEINRRLGGQIEANAGRLGGGSSPVPPPVSVPPSTSAPAPMPVHGGGAAAAIRAAVAMPAVAPACSPEMFDTSPNELLQLMQYVCSSPHVTSNVQYAAVTGRLVFSAEAKDATINAFATVRDGNTPMIMLLGGAIRFANLVSAAYVGSMAARKGGGQNPLPEITAAFGRFCLDCRGSIAPEQACRFAEQYNLHLVMADPTLGRKARSFASGLLIGVLAHEFGHLALGHCYGQRVNLEVSRNQEREADSFASSVISSSPFGDYLVFGTILWEAVWVWVEEATGQVATTHPLSRERLADLIRANPSVAAEFGLSA